MNFPEWIEANKDSSNIFAPPMSAQLGIHFLAEYLLGPDWYSVNPVSQEQINTEIIEAILSKYSKRYKVELKKYRTKRSKRRK